MIRPHHSNQPSKMSPTATPYIAKQSQEQESDLQIDQFLITALSNPRDRLTILKLDQELEKFIFDSSRNRLEFPPTSSYQRLIIHRVADHFNLDHVVTDQEGGKRKVVLFKSAESRIPVVRLSDLVEKQPERKSTSVKIMRRSTSPTSSSSSQPSQSSQAPPLVDRSLAQREAEYAKARARIFGSESSESQTKENFLDERRGDISAAQRIGEYEFYSPSDFSHPADTIFSPQPYGDSFDAPFYYAPPPYASSLLWQDPNAYSGYPTGTAAFPQAAPETSETVSRQSAAAAPPPLIFTYPHDDVWSFYGSQYPMGYPMGDQYPNYYSPRPPPKKKELFDPNKELPKKKSQGEGRNLPRGNVNGYQPFEPLKTSPPPNRERKAPEEVQQPGHILEICGSIQEGVTSELIFTVEQSGLTEDATIKHLSTTSAIVIFRTAQEAQNALTRSKEIPKADFTLRPWKVPLALSISNVSANVNSNSVALQTVQ